MQNRLNKKLCEQKVITIIRKLPPDRITQLLDFALFLEFQMNNSHLQTNEIEDVDVVASDNDKWDKLISSSESQILLEKMADSAMADIKANLSRPMAFSNEGKIIQK